ncbi:hypothetical protein [Thermomonas brevis]
MRHALIATALLMFAGHPHASIASVPAHADDGLLPSEIHGDGFSFPVYRASNDAQFVQENSASLITMYREISAIIGVNPGAVSWSEIAFTRDENYVQPRDKEGVARWVIPLTMDGTLGAPGQQEMFLTIPHEQAHAIQKAFGELPRWFSEGMAEWAGLKATKLVAPLLYADRKNKLNAAMKSPAAPTHLKSWGGVKPKPEAIFRQLTPEQKERMAKEPGYFPPGPFTFGPDDFVSDESNTFLRYAASRQVFETMESESSPEAMREWFSAVRNLPSPKTTQDIVKLAKDKTGLDISKMID